jgi:hypothetical protein
VGIWLLGGALLERGGAALTLVLAGIVVIAAGGMLLHFILSLQIPATGSRRLEGKPEVQYTGWAAVALAAALAVGGVLPGLWLPLSGNISSVVGGSTGVSASPSGISLTGGSGLPILFLAFGAAVLVVLCWVIVGLARRGTRVGGALLPAALEHLDGNSEDSGNQAQQGAGIVAPLLRNPSIPLRLLSLGWLQDALLPVGRGLSTLLTRAGAVLGRLEGRYYLPIALILTLVLLLAVTR